MYTNFVCRGDSVRQKKLCLWLWLSVTNTNSVCCSGSVQQTIPEKISNFFVACNKEIGEKKAKKKHPSKLKFHQCYQIALGYLKCNLDALQDLEFPTIL